MQVGFETELQMINLPGLFRSTWSACLRAGLAAALLWTIAAPVARSATPAPRKVVIAAGIQVPNSSYPYLFMPLALGYWQAEGLDVEIIPVGGSSQAIQQMVGGNADFVEVNATSFIQSVATAGVPMRAVMTNTTPGWALVSLAAGPIKSLADFKGRSIGVASLGTGGISLVQAYLRANGIDPDRDIAIQPVGSPGAALEALTAHRVDGLMYWSSALVTFEHAGVPLRYFKDPDWIKYADFSLVAMSRALADNPSIAEAMVRGAAKASLFSATNPDCARRMFWRRFPQFRASAGADDAARAALDLKLLQSGVQGMLDAKALGGGKDWGTAPVAGYARMQQFMLDNKIMTKTAAPENFVPANPGFFQRANAFDHEKVRQDAMRCADA
jgi:NitT/TauT family transport system substrate-binding protein